ncbi:uncharacterized protein F4822DRAFT_426286 [Hypoxylon trugodes]|uniref:uncharacterized protein n=1 Tax=Hypoxylon trugodes TaxID=326681 RepID=UPI002194A0DE|nr:uncharacterized protein F4822DRAFT_426286 [Hypoxylon trugodes]KAI1393091.1 hypothetical protein F4822DRAFT_426286 [Hypoxylon trugodes]
MQQSFSSVLWFLSIAPFIYSTSSSSTKSIPSAQDDEIVTSVITGSDGPLTEKETFVPTTYSKFVNISSTIVINTIFTIVDSSSTKLSNYSYKVGPGGIGWNIPTPSSGAPILLPPPTFLPGHGPTSRSSSEEVHSTQSSAATFSEIKSTASRASNPASSSSVSNSTIVGTLSTSSSLSTRQTSQSTHTISNRISTSTSTVSFGGIGPTTSSTRTESSGITVSSAGTSISTGRSSGSKSSSGIETSEGSKPPSTTTSSTVTSTATIPPTGFSAITLSGTSFPSNTWLTTTDKDHHTTILPVIVTGGGIGIAMWNLPPTPDVQFSFPKLPKFHLPCIKIFGVSIGSCTSNPASDGPPSNDDPTDSPTKTRTTLSTSSKPSSSISTSTSTKSSSSSSSSSTSECTVSKTVSNCAVQCATTTTSNSCISFTTECSQTRTGCSITGTTSTITSSASACTTCSSCLGRQEPGNGVPPYQTPGPNLDDEEDSRKRGIAGRARAPAFEKRGPSSLIVKISTCNLKTGSAKKLTRPPWPAVTATMLNPDKAGKMAAKYSTISRYDLATTIGACGVPTTTRVNALAFAAAPTYTDYAGKERPNNNDASLDHAYEKSWIKDFFTQIVAEASGNGKLSCADLNQFFFPTVNKCQHNLMQPIWNSIASEKNLDFIVMSQYLNGDGKGKFFVDPTKTLPNTFFGDPNFAIQNNAGWKWANDKEGNQMSAEDTLRTMIIYFETVLLGVLEMKSDSMLPLMDKTNNRVYDALLKLDNRIATDNKMFPNKAVWQTAFGTDGIAGAYKDYMIRVVLPQINVPPTYLTNLWQNTIKTGIAASENLPDVKTDSKTGESPGPSYPEWQKFSNFAQAVDAQYKKSGNYAWEYTFAFQWDRNNKRQEGDDQSDDEDLSCPFSSTSGVSTTSDTHISPSTSNTSLKSSSNAPPTITSTSSIASTLFGSPTMIRSNTKPTPSPTRLSATAGSSVLAGSGSVSDSSTPEPSRTDAPGKKLVAFIRY